jgi:3-deoxy-D-manno-octulosonic-acid transferase
MFWFGYNVLFHVVYMLMLPKFFWRMRRRGGYRRGFFQRIFRVTEAERARLADGPKLWVHAVSVGELNVGLSFMHAWRARHPEVSFLVTVNTSTAHAIAEKALGPKDILLYPPVDTPIVLKRLLKTVRLEGLVLVETEMWPNLLRALHRRGVPVALLNGRISDRSFGRLQRVPWLTRRIYPLVSLFCMQSDEDARRATVLGADPERVKVFSSGKYDLPPQDQNEETSRREALMRMGILSSESRVLLGSSTWPGEEAALVRVYLTCRERFPNLRLILVPRHFERTAEVEADLQEAGLGVLRWSQGERTAGRDDVLVVDTTGELRHFTGLAEIVFVGKSLYRSEGQNPLEAAAAGACVVTGPGMDNFREVMTDLRGAKAVREVRDETELERVVADVLESPETGRAFGVRAAGLVDSRRGAMDAALGEIELLFQK